jgi:hypothetical protein
MTSSQPSRRAAAILAAALALGALGALAAPASALRFGLEPRGPTIQRSAPSTPRGFRSDVSRKSGPCLEVCPSASGSTSTARGSDLEWAYLTLAGGPSAVLLIASIVTRANHHHRRQP